MPIVSRAELAAATPRSAVRFPFRTFTLALALAGALAASGSASAAPKDKAAVEIIEFASFQCPFSARAEGTLAELKKTYGDKLVLSYYHRPLPFHTHSRAAAIASEAARRQGKFAEMHDLLFMNQGALGDVELRGYAEKIGLDLARYDKDVADPALAAEVDRHDRIATAVGANGTPTFFVNGKILSGAQPLDKFAALIDEELAAAGKQGGKAWRDKRLQVANDALYRYVVKGEAPPETAPTPVPPTPTPDDKPALEGPPVAVPLANAPRLGDAKAAVEVVIFGGPQCPFSMRALPKYEAIVKASNGRVALRWKHLPLAFHTQSKPTAEHAVCAGEQGKFWEALDWAAEHPAEVREGKLDGLATALALDGKKLKKCLASGRAAALVEQDMKDAEALGVKATPTVFANGLKLSKWHDDNVGALLDELATGRVQPDAPAP